MKKIIILLACLFLLTGCATPFGGYMKNRGNDFADMFKAKVGVGLGLHADVQATNLAHLGLGGSALINAGVSRRNVGAGMEMNANPPILQLDSEAFKKRADFILIETGGASNFLITHTHQEMNSSIFGGGESEATWCYLSPFIKGDNKIQRSGDKKEIPNPFYRWFDVEAGGTAVFVGGRVGFSFGELLDFVFGIFTIDIAEDDNMKEEDRRIPGPGPKE